MGKDLQIGRGFRARCCCSWWGLVAVRFVCWVRPPKIWACLGFGNRFDLHFDPSSPFLFLTLVFRVLREILLYQQIPIYRNVLYYFFSKLFLELGQEKLNIPVNSYNLIFIFALMYFKGNFRCTHLDCAASAYALAILEVLIKVSKSRSILVVFCLDGRPWSYLWPLNKSYVCIYKYLFAY